MCRVTRLFRPTDRLTRTLLAPALVFIATSIDRNYQTDLWHHLARGRAFVEEGVLLDADRFTFTVPDRPFRDVNWGWQIAFYYLYRAGGLPLVQTVNSAVLALTMGLLFALARRHCDSPAVACGVCVVAFLGLWPLLIIRPQTFSLLLFVVLLTVLDAAVRKPRWLVLPPLVMALWVNMHGGFPIGLVLIGAYTLGVIMESIAQGKTDARQDMPTDLGMWTERGRGNPAPTVGASVGVGYPRPDLLAHWPWFVCGAVSVAATLANPYGWHVYQYVGLTSTAAAGRHIDEWLAPGLDTLTGKVWALSVALVVLLSALPGRRPTLREIIVLCCFLLLACGSVRMTAWWFLACVPVLAIRLVEAWPILRKADIDDDCPSLSSAVLCLLLVASSILSLPWSERFNPVFQIPGRSHRTETDLQAAVDTIAEHDGGRVFTRFAWGEYVSWALAPHGTVFMDGRIEIFPDEVWTQYAAITRGRSDWEDILTGYGVDWLLLDAKSGYHAQLLPLVERSGRWHEVFRQGNAVLFEHVSGSGTSQSE